ncbi:MAG: hypothetical protein L0I76_15030, partial [Pseudonocardia sp.]|nr:hypothetical protein [Pseudonocardia sp.]
RSSPEVRRSANYLISLALGDTWLIGDARDLRARIQKERVQAGEARPVLFTLRSVAERDEPDSEPISAVGPGDAPRTLS